MKNTNFNEFSKFPLLFISLALSLTMLPTAFSENIQIKNVGQIGFSSTNQEFTSIRTVILEVNFTENSSCRFSNDNVTFGQFELCDYQTYWLLSDGPGMKTVYLDINLTNNSRYLLSDTIFYNYTGAGLDTTPPTSVVILNDEFSNNNSSIAFSWSDSIDAESELLRIPIIYSYRILINGSAIIPWTNNGINKEVVYDLASNNISLNNNDNITLLVNATNSASLTSQNSSSIIIDLVSPTGVSVSSDLNQTSWHNHNSVFFNWSASDTLSGIGGYSYTFSTDTSIMPDDVIEADDSNNFQNHANKTFTSLTTGEYAFKIKPKDNAGNFGNITSYTVLIDTTSPSKPTIISSEKIYGANTINVVWSESYDENSGVNNYVIELWNNSYFNETLIGNYTTQDSNASNHVFGAIPENDGTYYARVKAIDAAGNPSIWSNQESNYDITPPSLTIIKPDTLVDTGSFPIIALTTNEKAKCYYSNQSGGFSEFQFTDRLYHETKPNDGQTTYTINCTDESGNFADSQISFGYDSNTVAGVSITPNPEGYSGQIVTIKADILPAKGELQKNRFKLLINGTESDFAVFDNGKGKYNLSFVAPKSVGAYSLEVISDSASSQTTLTVNPLTLTATYSDTFSSYTNSNMITYYDTSGMQIGLTSDSSDVSLNTNNNLLEISSLYDGKIYFFATTKIQNINSKNQMLREKTFLSQKRASFGYTQSAYNDIKVTLNYPTILISGSETLSVGEYNLVIKRISNSEKKEVMVTTKASNYNKKGVVQYD